MIAPLQPIDPKTIERRARVRYAYRMIASTFLPEPTEPTDRPPPVSAWRAWLFAGWVVVVTVVYFIVMLT